MALSVKFGTPAIVFSGDGGVRVKFDDGSENEYDDADSLRNSILEQLPTLDALKALAISNRLAADPLMDSPALWDGKTVTLDVELPNPAQVFRVV
jgi:hypothetical protein